MTDEEMAEYDKTMTQGTIEMSAKFDEKNLLESIKLSKYGIFSDASSSASKDTEVEEESADEEEETDEGSRLLDEIEAEAVYITDSVAKELYLLDDEGGVLVNADEIEAHYEDLAFTCESL